MRRNGPSGRGRNSRQEPSFFGDKSARPDELRATRDGGSALGRTAKKRLPKLANKNGSKRLPRRRSWFARLFSLFLTLGIWSCVALVGIVIYYAQQLPPIDQLAVPNRSPNIAIQSADGILLANRGDTGGAAIHLNDLPPYLPKAFVAIEDRRFYSHWGIDPIGIARAASRNIIHRGGMEGGSTLTQQLAKNLFLTQERTFSRKVQEAILAIWLERRYSKDQILELYLNRVYFGSGSYGVEAAAQKYFGHSAKMVSLSEAATLAGLMISPSRLAPNRNPEGANQRATQVLAAMAEVGYITVAMQQMALSHPAKTVHPTGAGSVNYVADYVMDVLDDTIGAIDSDIVVVTTIDSTLQNAGETALAGELDAKGSKFNVGQGALVSLDMKGAIKAMIGGRNYTESQFDRAVSAHRQPGSTFKPFVYLTALESGLSPDSVRDDAPIDVKGWEPENASHEYQGPVTLTKGLAMSLNTVAVRLGLELGPKNVAKTAHRLGIVSDLQTNASLVLGTSEVTPLEIAGAYVPFANGGLGVQPHIITNVHTTSDKLLYQRKEGSNNRVIDSQYLPMMNTMLSETLVTGTGKKANLSGWQAAGKTGTSQDYRDAWFIGFTSHLVTAVWLGNDDASPTKKASGANLPVEIWSKYMRVAHQNIPAAPLIGGLWPTQDQEANSVASNVTNNSVAGAPIIINQAGNAAATASTSNSESLRSATPTNTPPLTAAIKKSVDTNFSLNSNDSLLPPDDIPANTEPVSSTKTKYQGKNILEQLFGG